MCGANTQNRQEYKKQFKGKINNQNIPSDTLHLASWEGKCYI